MTTGTARVQTSAAGIAVAALALICTAANPALAQGRGLESLFGGAARFLERQGKSIERGLNELSGPEPASRRRVRTPPLPEPNPRRAATPENPRETAESTKKPLPPPPASRPRQPPEPQPEPHQRTEEIAHDETSDSPSPPPSVPSGETASKSASVQAPVALPDRNPDHSGTYGVAPTVPPHPGQVASEDWTRDEITAGLMTCTGELSGIIVKYEIMPPIRKGICGAPAPLNVSVIGKKHAVEIRPAATLTCHMTAGLARWLKDVVQPAATELLGENIVALRNIASYSCRNRYNAPGKRISEHAKANALDVAAFITASGKSVTVLHGWNEKKKKDKDEGESGASGKRGGLAQDSGAREKARLSRVAATSAGVPSPARTAPPDDKQPGLPEHKPDTEPGPDTEPSIEARFLHQVFDGACQMFGTTLGPEANAAHRNHFHLDMIQRNYGGYCE